MGLGEGVEADRPLATALVARRAIPIGQCGQNTSTAGSEVADSTALHLRDFSPWRSPGPLRLLSGAPLRRSETQIDMRTPHRNLGMRAAPSEILHDRCGC